MRPRDRCSWATAAAMALFLVAPLSAARADDDALLPPVICLHGFRGDATTFEPALEPLRAAGLEPIPLTFVPAAGDQGIGPTATDVIGPMIEVALAEHGYPPGQPFGVLAHSLGGLAIRHLVEGAGWGERVTRVVLLAVPNHGAHTGLGSAACTLPPGDPWRACGCDTRSGSPFLAELGSAPPPEVAARYLSIGASWRGTPMPGGGDMDGSGQGHANDGVVATESPYLEGVPFAIWKGRGPSRHTRLCCNSVIVDWVTGFLLDGSLPSPVPDPQSRIAGDLCEEPRIAAPGGGAALDTGSTDSTGPAGPAEPDPGAVELVIRVDASAAVDPLVQFKIRRGRLQLRLDDVEVLDHSERRAPRGDPVHSAALGPGEHRLELRWDVVFRSATDRHHPASSRPTELGFSVPDAGFATFVFVVEPGVPVDIVARLHRKASVGLQGRTWIEFEQTPR